MPYLNKKLSKLLLQPRPTWLKDSGLIILPIAGGIREFMLFLKVFVQKVIGIMVRVFVNGQGDRGSILREVILKNGT